MDFCHSYTQAQGTSVVGTQWEQFQQAFALLASPQQQFPSSPARDIHLPLHQRRPKLANTTNGNCNRMKTFSMHADSVVLQLLKKILVISKLKINE